MKFIKLVVFSCDFVNLALVFIIIIVTTLLKSLLELPIRIFQLSLLTFTISDHLLHLTNLFLKLIQILSIVRLKLLHFSLRVVFDPLCLSQGITSGDVVLLQILAHVVKFI